MSSLHSQSRENNVDLPEGTVKEPLNEDIKTRDLSTAIQTKSDNSKTPFIQKKSGLKENAAPPKTSDPNVTGMDDCLRRARYTNSVEWTGREEEKEQEWAPSSTFNLNVFDTKYYEQENNMAEQKDEQDAFPSLVSNEIEQQEHVTPLPPFKEEAEIKADFITPSTIEYGPPKEIELPFVPFNADIILINQFSAIAAISAYEARDYKEQEIHPVFEDDVDYDYIREIELQDDFYAFNLDDEEKESYEDIRIPFDDFLFHTQSLEC